MWTLGMFVLVASVGVSSAADPKTILCEPGGNAEIQACLEAASEGDVVAFAPGTYTIDSSLPPVVVENRGGLTLTAQWPDHPPQFACTKGDDDRPVQGDANVAFAFLASGGTSVPALTFANLSFRDCYTAVALRPSGGGSFADVQVRGLEIDNGIFGLSLQGVVAATVEDNEIRATERSIFVVGAAPRAQHVDITGNELVGPDPGVPLYNFLAGIQTVNVNGSVSDNEVTGFDRAVGVGGRAVVHADNAPGSFALWITDNELYGNQNGIGVGGRSPATGAIRDNEIYDSTRFGIAMVLFCTGWTVGPNEFKDNDWADIFLIGDDGSTPTNHGDRSIGQPPGTATHDNTVIVDEGTLVQDEGNNNTIIVLDAD